MGFRCLVRDQEVDGSNPFASTSVCFFNSMRYTAFSTTSSTSLCGQHVQLRCFCIGLANCYFADRGAKREKKKLNNPVRDKNRKNYSAGSRELSGTYGS